MRTKNFLKHLILGGLILTNSTVVGQTSVLGHAGVATDFLGWDNTVTNNFPLMVRHDLNQPIEWSTDALRRMLLTETLVGQTVNGFGPLDLSGHLGIGNFATLPGNPPPLTMLHLDNGGTEVTGYRPWMHTGTSMSERSEWMYVGFKREAGDRIDAVINWADNREAANQFGPDALRMVFTSPPTTTSLSGSQDGLEIARLIPDVSGNEGYFGIGDYFTAGVQPAERLDVLNGRVRIRQLPDDPEAEELTKFLVVDDVDPASPEYGVVKWRHLPVVPPGTSCDWTLLGAPGSNSNIATAYNGNPGCPQGDRRVGIGTNAPQGKLSVESRAASQGGPGIGVDVKVLSATNAATGLRVNVQPESGTINAQTGITSMVENSTLNNYAITGAGNVNAGLTQRNNAFRGRAYVNDNGEVLTNEGGHFRADQGPGGLIHSNFGLWSGAYGGNRATGVYALAEEYGTGTTASIGVDAIARDASVKNIGVSGVANTTHLGVGINYGVYGSAMNGSVNWGGYFGGNVNATGTGYFVNGTFVASDAQFKTNVEALEDPLGIVMQLQPHRYEYLTEPYPQMNFPSEPQVGLIAQELESVVPALVSNTRVEAITDTMGTEISPVVEYKAVNYAGLVPYLIGAVQQQQATITQLQAQLDQCCAANQGMPPHGGAEERKASSGIDLLEQRLLIIPNPVTDLTTLEYYVPTSGKVSLSVSTSDGKPLGMLREGQAEPGAYSYQWNTTMLAAGTYFCTYMLDGSVVVKRAVKVVR